MTTTFQVAVIGGGPGGYSAAVRCAELGLQTVCIEERPLLGGTCLNVGCIPSKTLLHTSWLYAEALNSQKLGLKGEMTADITVMMEHKDEVVRGLGSSVAALFKQHGVIHRQGRARLGGAHHLILETDAGTEEITAENIILATGSLPIALQCAPFDEERILSSTGALALHTIPEELIVVGAGAIGVELASVYRRLGSRVSVIEMLETICPGQDAAVSRTLQRALEHQGVTFHLGSQVKSVKREENGVTVAFQKQGGSGEETVWGSHLLIAVGRRPASQGLGLDDAAVATDSKGFITVDEQFRSSQPHIFAIGDLIAGAGLAHRASEEGLAVAEILGGGRPFVNYLAIPNVIYTDPEVAAVGLTEASARDHGLDIAVGVAYFRGNARARCSNSVEGFVKIVADKASHRLVGMHIIGPQASELIAVGALAIASRGTVTTLAYAAYAHPTLSEAIKEAALATLRVKR